MREIEGVGGRSWVSESNFDVARDRVRSWRNIHGDDHDSRQFQSRPVMLVAASASEWKATTRWRSQLRHCAELERNRNYSSIRWRSQPMVGTRTKNWNDSSIAGARSYRIT